MTYPDTHKLVTAISALETWSRALERQHNKEGATNYEEIGRIEKWLAEARQDIFDVANDLANK
mgnify:FL=1|tara:strand:+ start:220 stop:408 length:189 start_codon:yes stop_codon:yes gene_type:complete